MFKKWIVSYSSWAAPTYATWNPSDKSADITLTNWNLTAENTWTGWDWVRSTISKTSWKWYWEVTVDVWASENIAGIWNSSATLTNYLWSDANAWGYYGAWYKTNSWITAYWATYTNWDVIGIAVDLDTNDIEFFKNNVSQWVAFTWLTWTYFAMLSPFGNNSAKCTANFWATTMAYTAPSWFNQGLYE
jgi:hypothetical protein